MLFGTNQRKPMGLFGGFAPSGGQQMPQADPMGMQQPLGQEAAASMQGALQQQRKPGVNWLGVLADTLAGAAGREGPYVASMRARQEQEAAQENARQQREQSMQDWRTKFDYERANPAPKDPYRFEDNAGNVWQMGPDGQPQRIFTDQAPKQYMTNGGMVNVPNPYANGAGVPQQDDDEWGPVVNQRPGGASGNAGGNFPRY